MNIKLYYHKTTGGAEYLCSSNVKGTDYGSFESKYIVRVDGDITKDAELSIKEVLSGNYDKLMKALNLVSAGDIATSIKDDEKSHKAYKLVADFIKAHANK